MKAIITNRYLLVALMTIGLLAIARFIAVSMNSATIETAQVATIAFIVMTSLLSWATLTELKKLTS